MVRASASFLSVGILCGCAMSLAACSSESRSGVTVTPDAGPNGDVPPVVTLVDDGGTSAPATSAEVFGQSDTTLYRLDPTTKEVKVVGNFDGCFNITDIALDEQSNMYGASDSALYRIDRTTAKCSMVAQGSAYPNSLSFIPKGILDPNSEVLVGFVSSAYYRIDTQTGNKTSIGSLGMGYFSSGDIVSVKGGATYLTVGGNGCHDCLVEIDPKNGSIKKNYGALGYEDVYGLTFWGGAAYGFTESGKLFEIKFVSAGTGVGTVAIAIPAAPSGLSFWGAGSTTAAPLTPIR